MPNYQNGRIYLIRGGDEVYYGSTTQALSVRMAQHRDVYRKGTDKKTPNYLFLTYGVENCMIELVELWPCTSIEELEAREAYWVKNNPCVNKHTAQHRAQWYKENKVRLAELRDTWNKKNKKHRAIYEAKRNAARNEKGSTVCACGGSYRDYNKRQHEETKKHKNYLNQTAVQQPSVQTAL